MFRDESKWMPFVHPESRVSIQINSNGQTTHAVIWGRRVAPIYLSCLSLLSDYLEYHLFKVIEIIKVILNQGYCRDISWDGNDTQLGQSPFSSFSMLWLLHSTLSYDSEVPWSLRSSLGKLIVYSSNRIHSLPSIHLILGHSSIPNRIFLVYPLTYSYKIGPIL